MISSILKDLIAQPRPFERDGMEDYGMPSSHTLFAFYFGSITILQIYFIPNNKLNGFYKCVYILAASVSTSSVGFARFYLKYHTVSQVLVGAGIGILIAILWFTLSQSKMIRKFFQVFCNSKLGCFLLLRNYDQMQYAALDEYMLINKSTKIS